FLRWFIPGRAEHARRMKTLSVDVNGNFVWPSECEASFQHVKQSVLQNAVSSGDPQRQYHLATDASLTGCGGVLFKILDTPVEVQSSVKTRQKERLVMFMSRAFDKAQSNYSTTDREALACLVGLEEARLLILGSSHPTFLYTDHQALVKMLTSEDTRGRIARWQ
ncbi:DNA/RNA polymerase, partial [Ascobolus immersus RN42]